MYVSTSTTVFQITSRSFEEAEGPEIKLATFIGSWRKQGSLKKYIYFCLIGYTKALTVWITTNCGKFLKRWKFLKSPLNCKETKTVNSKGNQSWIFVGRTDAEAEARILWPPDVKRQLTGKDPDGRKDWGQKDKGRWLDDVTDSMDMNLSKLGEVVEDRGTWHAAVQEITKSQTWLSNWTT